MWLGAPENELGVSLPIRVPLARTDRLAVLVDQVVAYSIGFTFRLSVRSHPDHPVSEHGLHGLFPHPDGDMRKLLVGVEFADGRKATNLAFPQLEQPVEGPVLIGGGGGGGGGRFDFGFWVWPLPPDGPLTFVCRWSAEGVEQTRAEIDAGSIGAAALLSELLWPERGDGGGGGWTTSSELA